MCLFLRTLLTLKTRAWCLVPAQANVILAMEILTEWHETQT